MPGQQETASRRKGQAAFVLPFDKLHA